MDLHRPARYISTMHGQTDCYAYIYFPVELATILCTIIGCTQRLMQCNSNSVLTEMQ